MYVQAILFRRLFFRKPAKKIGKLSECHVRLISPLGAVGRVLLVSPLDRLRAGAVRGLCTLTGYESMRVGVAWLHHNSWVWDRGRLLGWAVVRTVRDLLCGCGVRDTACVLTCDGAR